MTTRWPFFKRMSRTCAAMKPEPPVRRTRVMVVGVVVVVFGVWVSTCMG